MGSDAPELIVCGMDSLENWYKKFILGNRLRRIEMKGKVSNSEAKKLMSESQVQIMKG